MQQTLDKILPWLWALVWFTLPLSLRINSASIILVGIVATLRAFNRKPEVSQNQIITGILFILLFVWHGLSYFFDNDLAEVKFSLERKLAFIAIPIVIALMNPNSFEVEKWAIRGFFAGLLISGCHLLLVALVKIFSGAEISEFTYHAFIDPYYPHGAIYYSWYLSSAILFLLFKKSEPFIQRNKTSFTIFLLILLFFNASKFFIALTLPIVIWQLTKRWIKLNLKQRVLSIVVALAFIILGSIPFLNRVNELKNTQLEVLNLTEYSYDTPFNGLTFRLVEWRLAFEILDDKQGWLTGVGIGSKQNILNKYFEQYGIYTGNPELGDSGYLDYNFHNQYIEILVGTGIPGFILLLLILFNNFVRSKGNYLFPFFVYLITGLFLIIESVLERQSGIVFFCLIFCLIIGSSQTNTIKIGSNNSH